MSILHDAALSGDTERVRGLLEHGANVNAKDIGGGTPLHWGAHYGDTATADLLRRHGGVE